MDDNRLPTPRWRSLPTWWTGVMFCGRVQPGVPAHAFALKAGLVALTCLLFLARLDHPLLEPEEARYAEIPRQMLMEGRFLTPVLDGQDYWQKPPLLYWLVLLAYQSFGVHDWSARLIPALAGIACVLVTVWWGERTLGFWGGLVGGSILALSPRFLYLAGMVAMDGVLCACVLASLASGHIALAASGERKRWLVLSAFACGLGILTKGPVALVLVGVPLSAFAYLDRRCRWLSKAEAALCLGLIGLIAGPWFVGMAIAAPAAAREFFWLHNLLRFAAPLDHEKPAWFYLPGLLLGMLPWSLLLLPLLPYLLRQGPRIGRRRPAALGFFVIAFAWCVLFFSVSGCKRPAYVLPAFPLFALMLGTFLTYGCPWRRWMQSAHAYPLGRRWGRALATIAFGMGAALAVAAAVVGLTGWTAAAILGGAFIAAGMVAWFASRRGGAWRSWLAAAAVSASVLAMAQRVWLPAYHDRFGLRRQVEIASEYEQEEPLPILTYPKRWDSIGFYAGRTDIASHADLDQLVRDVRLRGKAILFMRRDESLRTFLERLPAEMEIDMLGRSSDYIVVGVVRMRVR